VLYYICRIYTYARRRVWWNSL